MDNWAEYYDDKDNIRHFHLIAEPIKHYILDKISVDAMGYNGSTPGPLIVVNQGEWAELKVENKLDQPTALHIEGFSNSNFKGGITDNEPDMTKIQPGESVTYRFLAWKAGTFFYHSYMGEQMSKGLIGIFMVLPSKAK